MGAKLQLLNGQNAVTDFVPLPGGATAVYTAQAGGLAYYRHSDWLGSSRFASTPSRTVYYDGAYGPFGEPYAQSGTTDLNFTGMNQDTASNVYDFPAREYGIQGRWPSPDPAGLAAVNPMDPQTWNRYAYVRNSPLELIDPTGMAPQPPPGDPGNGGCQYAVERMDPVTERTWWECVISSSDGNTGAGSKKKVEPQTPQQKYQKCMQDFQSSDVGKAVQFGSLLSFASDFWNTAKDWGEAIFVKGTYFRIAETAGQSLQSAGEITPVATVAKPLAGELAVGGVLLATAADAANRAGCFYGANPDLNPYMNNGLGGPIF